MKPFVTKMRKECGGPVSRLLWRTRLLVVIAAGMAVGELDGGIALAESDPTREYMVKATCLFNFAKFVEWPSAVFSSSNAPIVIGILGDDEFGPFLNELVRGETVKGRPLAVRRSKAVADLKACHILFVSRSESARADRILSELGDTPILTVGETKGFADGGGTFNFFIDGGKVRFEINLATARRRGLRIPAQLCSLARMIGSAAEGGGK